MSGHSKWAQIKHRKAATDQKKGQAFSKLVRQITIAVREGGADPASNFKLRLVMEKAREAEMPKDTVDRAIEKAAGGGEGTAIEQVTYEGYGPAGTAFIVEVATDNKNRAAATIRHLFEKHGGTLAQPNAVAWKFETRGEILAEVPSNADRSELELAAIDSDAEDVSETAEGLTIYTPPLALAQVKKRLEKLGASIVSNEIVKQSKNPTILSDEQKKPVRALYNALTDEDEVMAVFTSANL